MVTDAQEYQYGLKKEIELKPTLENWFGVTLKETKKWASFDFEGEGIIIELKSRRNTKDRYPTTIVGMNKVKKIAPNTRVVFAFNFTDGLWIWEYEENDFEVVNIQRRDRRNIPPKPYLSIPIEVLTKIE